MAVARSSTAHHAATDSELLPDARGPWPRRRCKRCTLHRGSSSTELRRCASGELAAQRTTSPATNRNIRTPFGIPCGRAFNSRRATINKVKTTLSTEGRHFGISGGCATTKLTRNILINHHHKKKKLVLLCWSLWKRNRSSKWSFFFVTTTTRAISVSWKEKAGVPQLVPNRQSLFYGIK